MDGTTAMHGRMRTIALFAALLIAAFGTTRGHADSGPLRTLTGQTTDVPALIARGQAVLLGVHPLTDTLTLNIGQSVRNHAALDAFIGKVTDPHNLLYDHYLTMASYLARYAPTGAATQAVRDWATGAGLTVLNVSPDNLIVTVSGTTAQVESALGVVINDYRRADGSPFYATTSAASVPAALDIESITGLSSYDRPVPANIRTVDNVNGYFPGDLRTAYDISGIATDASGEVIGQVYWGGKISSTDLSTFAAKTMSTPLVVGQKGNDGIDFVPIDGNPMTDTTASNAGEEAGDVEIAHGVAPGSHIKSFLAPCTPGVDGKNQPICSPTDSQLEDALNAAVADPSVHIIFLSWGLGRLEPTDPVYITINNTLQRSVAAGITVFGTTGDIGKANGPDFPSSSPYDVAVGGTTLNTNNDFTYNSESGWSGSGGGCDSAIPRPSWQAHVTATDAGQPCTGRAIPDVAADADSATGAIEYYQGHTDLFFGTSLAAPIWAGMTAVIDHDLTNSGLFGTGFLAPELYNIEAGSAAPLVFHDITQGNNGYQAGKGWDEVTGLGSADALGLDSQLSQDGAQALITSIAGASPFTSCPAGNREPAAQDPVVGVSGVATAPDGSIYLAIPGCNRVYRIDTNGNLIAVAGTGAQGYTGDGGAASNATLYAPYDVAVDANQNVYIADSFNNVVREVTNGTIRTLPGAGKSANLGLVYNLAVDSSSQVYLADLSDDVVRKVTTQGTLVTIAGTLGAPGSSGDYGPATSAHLNNPYGVAVDTAGNVFISDRGNNLIRKVDTSGIITTYLGGPACNPQDPTCDPTATNHMPLYTPEGIAIDRADNLYFTEVGTGHNDVQELDNTLGYYPVAGAGACGFSGDKGLATNATLCNPEGLALDKGDSQLFVADTTNGRIRRIGRASS